MSIKIKWVPMAMDERSMEKRNNEVNISYFPPEPAFKYFKENRKESEYLKCPAFSKALKNTFVIRSPYDIVFVVDMPSKSVTLLNHSQEFYDSHFHLHDIFNDIDPFIVAGPPRYLFLTDSKVSVDITVKPMMLTPNSDFGIITGSFDMTKWVRLVSCAFEVYKTSQKIEIKRGDPVYMVTFTPKNDDTVILEQDVCTKEMIELQDACVRLKSSLPNLNLNTLYNMADAYIKIMIKKIFK